MKQTIVHLVKLGLPVMLVALVLSIGIGGCSEGNEPSIKGKLVPWEEAKVGGRQLVLTHIIDEDVSGNGVSLKCMLTQLATRSKRNGDFQFLDVAPGTYFILYESGKSNFDTALARWMDELINLDDVDWLMDEFYSEYCGAEQDEIMVTIPGGTSIFAMDKVMKSGTILLMHGNSPFIVAHEVGPLLNGDSLNIIRVEVEEGKTAEVEFEVYPFPTTGGAKHPQTIEKA